MIRSLAAAIIVFGLVAAESEGQTNSLFGKSRARVRSAAPAAPPAAAGSPAPRAGSTAAGQAMQTPADPSARHEAASEAGLIDASSGQPMRSVKPRKVLPDSPRPMNPGLLAVSLIAVEPPSQKKYRVHDQVTVIVREDKRSISNSRLESDKSWDISTDLQDWIRLDPRGHLVPQNFTRGQPNVGFTFDNQYDGKGKSERKDSLITRITATVIDVKPNGLLVLEAKKTIRNEEDEQVTTLTGTCRSDDVTPDNTVLSTQLADVAIVTSSTGPLQDAATRGWLMRAFDFLKPL